MLPLSSTPGDAHSCYTAQDPSVSACPWPLCGFTSSIIRLGRASALINSPAEGGEDKVSARVLERSEAKALLRSLPRHPGTHPAAFERVEVRRKVRSRVRVVIFPPTQSFRLSTTLLRPTGAEVSLWMTRSLSVRLTAHRTFRLPVSVNSPYSDTGVTLLLRSGSALLCSIVSGRRRPRRGGSGRRLPWFKDDGGDPLGCFNWYDEDISPAKHSGNRQQDVDILKAARKFPATALVFKVLRFCCHPVAAGSTRMYFDLLSVSGDQRHIVQSTLRAARHAPDGPRTPPLHSALPAAAEVARAAEATPCETSSCGAAARRLPAAPGGGRERGRGGGRWRAETPRREPGEEIWDEKRSGEEEEEQEQEEKQEEEDEQEGDKKGGKQCSQPKKEKG
ncbi:hypothetical protein EYF80_020326 [Liparis tanakae]|uniref:Uncharacterized protein n=1 Tax=Liparis tanakae TaxID=230148 RepID=A0A4Z2HX52_9TELE|nr:hypothetical protein EYF80_020326 [Liparis tanakae]